MWQLIRTVRTLEAQWWKVCGKVWLWVQRKMSQALGVFGLLYYVTARSCLVHVFKLMNLLFL